MATPALMWWLFPVPHAWRITTGLLWYPCEASLKRNLVNQEIELGRVSLPGLEILADLLGDICTVAEGNFILCLENCERTVDCCLMGKVWL